jgi:hypothetical protein
MIQEEDMDNLKTQYEQMSGNYVKEGHIYNSSGVYVCEYSEELARNFIDNGNTWDSTKNLNDFEELVKNLRAEGHTSRADAVQYLIDRARNAEEDKTKIYSLALDIRERIQKEFSPNAYRYQLEQIIGLSRVDNVEE